MAGCNITLLDRSCSKCFLDNYLKINFEETRSYLDVITCIKYNYLKLPCDLFLHISCKHINTPKPEVWPDSANTLSAVLWTLPRPYYSTLCYPFYFFNLTFLACVICHVTIYGQSPKYRDPVTVSVVPPRSPTLSISIINQIIYVLWATIHQMFVYLHIFLQTTTTYAVWLLLSVYITARSVKKRTQQQRSL